jgi:hypothetical protein
VPFAWQPVDYRLLELLDEYGALTVQMLLCLIPEETYDHINARLRTLWRAGEVERLKGMQACVYSRKKGKQLPHRLARSRLHLCVEQFSRAHPDYQYTWVNEAGKRADLVIPDARFRVWNTQFEAHFTVEIDQSWENVLLVVTKMQAHLAMREEAQKTGTYVPYRVLFATNNIDNRLARLRRRMAQVEESKISPNFILYTDQSRYCPEKPESLFFEPIWQTAHSDECVSLLRR